MGSKWEINLWTPCPVCDTAGLLGEPERRCGNCGGSGYRWELYRRGNTLHSAVLHWLAAIRKHRPVEFIWRPDI